MNSSTTNLWRWGLSDAHIEMLREFRETTDRQHSIHSSTFLEFLDPETIPGEHHVMEFLWAYAPLYYRSHPEPFDELLDEVTALLRFMAPRQRWQPDACLTICADSKTFQLGVEGHVV